VKDRDRGRVDAVAPESAGSGGLEVIMGLNRYAALLLSLSVIALVLGVGEGRTQERSECPEYDLIQYTEVRQLLRDRIILETTTDIGGRFPSLRRFEEIPSPHRTARALISRPDTTQQGPWTTVLAVRGNEVRPLELLVTVKDHGTDGVRVRWLNEKLLWFRVWWGVVVATELLVNVENAEILFFEESDYRQLLLGCEEKRESAAEEAETE
jgi:hypothetical protein